MTDKGSKNIKRQYKDDKTTTVEQFVGYFVPLSTESAAVLILSIVLVCDLQRSKYIQSVM